MAPCAAQGWRPSHAVHRVVRHTFHEQCLMASTAMADSRGKRSAMTYLATVSLVLSWLSAKQCVQQSNSCISKPKPISFDPNDKSIRSRDCSSRQQVLRWATLPKHLYVSTTQLCICRHAVQLCHCVFKTLTEANLQDGYSRNQAMRKQVYFSMMVSMPRACMFDAGSASLQGW